MEKDCGSVSVCGRVAYAAQQAWIVNGTVQENILFGRVMDREYYEKVWSFCHFLFRLLGLMSWSTVLLSVSTEMRDRQTFALELPYAFLCCPSRPLLVQVHVFSRAALFHFTPRSFGPARW